MARGASLGIGIVGCGRIARLRHLPILKKMREVRLVAAADTEPETLARVASQYGIARRYRDHRELLEDPGVDAVLVCTPPRLHFEPARDVLLSGRHLYVDSPLAISEAECNTLVDVAASAGRVATVGLNLRHHSLVERAHRCIQAGRLGSIQAISATLSTPSRGLRGDRFPDWRRPDTVDGSVFIESAIQHFDIWRLLTGAEFAEVFVQARSMGGPVSLAATLRERGGTSADPIVVGAVCSEYSGDNNHIRVLGRNGTLSLSLYRYDGFRFYAALEHPGSLRQHLAGVAESIRALPQGLRNLAHAGEYGLTFRRLLSGFVQACVHGQSPRVSLADGKAATIAALAAFQSMSTGRSVSIA